MNDEMTFWRRLLWQDWPHRLTVLLCGIFLLQFTYWIAKEDNFWLPETILIVQLTLLATAVFEHIPKLHWLLRGAVQLVTIVTINVLVLEHYKVIRSMPLKSFASSKLFLNLYELTPYLWFALGAWVLYLTAIWLVEVKWRIYALLIVSVLALCIRDSFSTVYLWPQVAMMVCCGLFLLILCHFQKLRRKDPAAWSRFADYPASIAVPVISLISLTVFLGALMPEIGPVVTDPYTAWRQLRGEPMNFTTGKGVQVTAIASEYDSSSGYSRSDASLGGGFQFDYTPVMTVDTTHRGYWRGETRSLYTGKGWDESDSEKRGASTAVRPDNPVTADPRQPASKPKTVEVTQTVTMLTEQHYPVLFGAYAVSRVTDVNGAKTGFDAMQWSAPQSELKFNERNPYPKTYTIVSQVPVIDEDALLKLPAEPASTGMEEFLQLPGNLPDRVRKLAADITKDAVSPYEKAKKLEQYLQKTYPYTNKPDLSKGHSRDFVDRFLFEIKEGYCDYYSSAMAVMARSLGLPTRWVKGYASGTSAMNEDMLGGLVPDEGLIDPDAAGVYTVRNADAHSWVEIYFAGFGWIPFEPTAGFVLPRTVPEPELAIDTSTVPADLTADAEAAGIGIQAQHVVWTGGSVVLLALLAYMAWKFQALELIQERVRRRRALQLKQKIIVECERLLRIFRRNGYVREEHETLREAVRRWTKQSKWMTSELDTVLLMFEKAKYGKSDVTEDDLRQTTQIVEKLRAQM
ncbi:transglutaminase TgpA family protein [Paenibacillus cremeus]|uniref:Transglutaminase domain-containing protein n=1 Tax=Paenibacillus cremeus TaxID=2163881 RepID=A0A559KAA5_9BACL|nr:transglutaminaseTgpA domain-containing protein [Paenibacillus cremeus]TVY09052.1 transglutaminase domain-containing protein [Paenibacillus cremeus]